MKCASTKLTMKRETFFNKIIFLSVGKPFIIWNK